MTSRFTRPNVLFQMNEADLEEMSKRNYRSGERWFVKDPCGIVCAVMTYCLVAYGTFAFLTILVPPFVSVWTMINAGIYLSLVALAIISHYKSMCTEPGVVAREPVSEEEVLTRHQNGEKVRYCKKCRSLKPDRAHHCSTCERCIHRMDHHCPWVNNCVGENNQKYFVLFTLYIMLLSVHGLLTCLWFFIKCATQDFKGCAALYPGPVVFILTLMGVFEGFLFALFTCMMFFSQLHSIATDETGIESLKQESRERLTWQDSFYEVFGSSFGVKWLSPFTPPPNALRRRYRYTVNV